MSKGKNNMSMLVITTAVGLLLMLVLISSLATQANVPTTLSSTAESTDLTTNGCYSENGQVDKRNSTCNITVTNVPTGWKVQDCPISSVIVSNTSGGHVLTVDTDYVLYADKGVIAMRNTTSTNTTNLAGGNVLTTYSYCGTGYVNLSWGRSVIQVTIGLFSLGILILVIYLVYHLYNNNAE